MTRNRRACATFSPTALKPSLSASRFRGIYIHVPFCRAKCPYCDFYSTTRTDLIPHYVTAVTAEIDRHENDGIRADSVYFGGGTPSLLTARQIGRILDATCRRFSVRSDAEVTLEVNPGTVNRSQLAEYRDVGINRLNIGLQSMDDGTLAFLGRIHSARQGIAAYDDARAAGFENVGLDLIFAVPGQTRSGWAEALTRIVGMGPDHLSCYALTWEADTPLTRRAQAGRVRPMPEKRAAFLFAMTGEHLRQNGYHRYEISNFARCPIQGDFDFRSRHNRKYWDLAPYLGFGPAAHSFQDHRRWWNHRSLDRYLAALEANERPVAGREVLTREQQIMEFVYLGLRKTDGIDTKAFFQRFGEDFGKRFEPALPPLIEGGWLTTEGAWIRLTEWGMRFLESVAGRLLA